MRAFLRKQGRLLLLGASGLASAACQKSEKSEQLQVEKPETSAPVICEEGTRREERGVPLRLGEFCQDPRVDRKQSGSASSSGLTALCQEFLLADCEFPKRLQLQSLRSVAYVDEKNPARRLRVIWSEFPRQEAAWIFFLHRVLEQKHPQFFTGAELSVPGGRAVLKDSLSHLWQGRFLLELRYENLEQTPAERAQESRHVLPTVTAELAQALGAEGRLPYEVELLQGEQLWPWGWRWEEQSLLELSGVGSSWTGFFRGPRAPYQIVLAVREEESAAKDLFQMLRRVPRSRLLQNKTVVSVRRLREGYAPETWYWSRVGRVVYGVGPDTLLAPPGDEKEWETFALQQILAWRRTLNQTPPPSAR